MLNLFDSAMLVAMSQVTYTLCLGEETTSSCQIDGTLSGLSAAIEEAKNQINSLISNNMNTNGAAVPSMGELF